MSDRTHLPHDTDPPSWLDQAASLFSLLDDEDDDEVSSDQTWRSRDERAPRLLRRAPPHFRALSWLGGSAPAIELERWPFWRGRPLSHLITVDARDVPAWRLQGDDGFSVFVDLAALDRPSRLARGASAVVPVSSDELDRSAASRSPAGVPTLDEAPLDIAEIPRGMALDEVAAASLVGPPPEWLQLPKHHAGLLMWLDPAALGLPLAGTRRLAIFEDGARLCRTAEP